MSAPNSILADIKNIIRDERSAVLLNYALLLFMIMTLGFTGIIALVIAGLYDHEDHPLSHSHYQFQKRTFWFAIGPLILAILSLRLAQPILTYGLVFIVFFYVTIRCVMGFNHVFHSRAHPRPKTFLA